MKKATSTEHSSIMAINNMLQAFISQQETPETLFHSLLAELIVISESEFGFIGELLKKEDGASVLQMKSISDISWDDRTRKLYHKHAPYGHGLEFHITDNLFSHVAITGKPVISNDPATDPRAKGTPAIHPQLNSFLGFPIYFNDRLIGIIGLANRPDGFSESLLEKLKVFESCCAVMISSLRQKANSEEKINTLQQEIREHLATDEKQDKSLEEQVRQVVSLNKELKRQESFLNEVGRVSKVGGWELSLHDQKLSFTEETYRIYGLEVNSEIPAEESLKCYLDGGDQIILDAVNRLIETGEEYDLEFRFKNYLNEILWVRTIGKREVINGKPTRIYGTFQDITQQKEHEQQLSESETRYRELVEHSPLAIAIHSEGIVKYVNPAAITLLKGQSANDFIGKAIAGFVHSDSRDVVFERVRHLLTNGVPAPPNEEKLLSVDGKPIEVEISASLVSFEGKPAVQAIIQDITERRKAQKLIHDSQINLSLGQKMAKMGSWQMNIRTLELSLSTEHLVMMGITSPEIAKTTYQLNEYAREFVHPEDFRLIKERLFYAIEHHNRSFQDSFEYRLRHKDGTLHYMIVRTSYYDVGVIMGVTQDITPRKAALLELEKAKSNFEALLSNTNDMISAVNEELRYTFVNPSFKNYYKQSFGDTELLGKHFSEVIPPDSLPFLEESLTKALKGSKQRFEKEVGGFIFDFSLNPILLGEKVIGVSIFGRDITKQKKIEDELRKLALIAQNTDVGVIISDKEGKVEWVNIGFEKMYGYSRKEMAGKTPAQILTGEKTDPETQTRIKQTFTENVPFKGELLAYRKNGKPIWVSLEIQPVFNEEGEVLKYFSIEKDISERREQEESLKAKNAELLKINEELDNFVYRVSHDLRAPLSSSLGLLDLINNLNPSEEISPYLQLQLKSLHKMDSFISDILDFSRNSRMELNTEPVLLREIIEEIIANNQYSEEGQKMTVSLEISPELLLVTDLMRIRVIFNNLIANAYRYSNPYIENPFLKISAQPQEAAVEVHVQDNGIGIKQEHLNGIFKMFYRGTDHKPGSGLGLYIVKESLEKLGGKISVTSEVNRGSSFTLLIPNRKELPD